MLLLREAEWRVYPMSLNYSLYLHVNFCNYLKSHLKISTWINSSFVIPCFMAFFLPNSFSIALDYIPVSCTQQHLRWVSMPHRKHGEKRTTVMDCNWVFICQNGSKHLIHINSFNLYNNPWGFYNPHFTSEKNQALRNEITCSTSHSRAKTPYLLGPKASLATHCRSYKIWERNY